MLVKTQNGTYLNPARVAMVEPCTNKAGGVFSQVLVDGHLTTLEEPVEALVELLNGAERQALA